MTVRPDAIVLDHVHVRYPGSTADALSDVSLTIPAGQHVCLLGGNGSGKSTLLQLINALALPSSGTVQVLGMDTADPSLTLKIRSQAECVFQHPEDQMVTSVVADDVAFGPENLRMEQPRIARLVQESLAAVGMLGHSDGDPADLSGGQIQRVAIAGAVAMQPRILLLDEPCAMLDMEGRSAVRRIIERLSDQGITIVHITHFAEDACMAERAIVLEGGRVSFDGAPADAVALANLTDPKRAPGNVLPGNVLPGNVQHQTDIFTAESSQNRPFCAEEPEGGGGIVFEDVSFSYVTAKNPRRTGRTGMLRKLLGRSPRTEGPQDSERMVPLALGNVSFTVRPGTLTALVGRTGSGKSTAAALACALKLPRTGSVRVNGIDTADLSRRRELRAQVGFVSQFPERQLFAETVFDDIAFGPRNLGLPEDEVRSRVHEALASVNMPPADELLARSPFALSGGQQRAVALAGVLAMHQPVLVLDEPMAGLDGAGQDRLRALIAHLKQAGTALLMVTHSAIDAELLADQVIALENGAITHRGTPAEVLPLLEKEASSHGAAR